MNEPIIDLLFKSFSIVIFAISVIVLVFFVRNTLRDYARFRLRSQILNKLGSPTRKNILNAEHRAADTLITKNRTNITDEFIYDFEHVFPLFVVDGRFNDRFPNLVRSAATHKKNDLDLIFLKDYIRHIEEIDKPIYRSNVLDSYFINSIIRDSDIEKSFIKKIASHYLEKKTDEFKTMVPIWLKMLLDDDTENGADKGSGFARKQGRIGL